MSVSAAEQYLLELINRARLDPLAEAARYGLDLNAGLDDGSISATPKQVLAHNTELESSALDHSKWMLDEDIFSHEGDAGSDPGDRIKAAGYELIGAWTWRENLAWTGSTGTLDLAAAIEDHHEGLYLSAGHRANTFATDTREIGVAQVSGRFTHDGSTFNASMLTLNFASSGADYFITGVVYTDSDNDDFYSIGEGVSGLTFSADGNSDVSAAAGGYGVAVAAASDVGVTISLGSAILATLDVDLTDGNAKLDLVTDNGGTQSLALSANATLLTGIADAILLGAGDLNLTGNDDDNVLTGNSGDNILYGGNGDDTLSGAEGADRLYGGAGDDLLKGGTGRDVSWDQLEFDSAAAAANADILTGGTGDDRLQGQSGNDVLDGGAGDDRLTGGGGRDTFIFNAGNDVILDFTDRVDNIQLDGAALGIATVDEAMAMAQIVDGNAVFDFGVDDTLRINDVDDLSILFNDLTVF
ncbi:Ca2+-binding RTX toxin-like protein [Loktanella ponticola]|uniref:Ca2+-binding RTX toxin-like protein n=1 Tax=Yoonia ponticola TaxID=1524255 RepID=A0A7W9EZD9_9RHOB|nr:CAP domain-containing protein [Yoonia ponticola]MBB5723639.1 Ca2+-binding RTX toxin-like protein [Yoonia ponticola]